MPTRASPSTRRSPRCTAATSTPMAIAKTAGSTPRRTRTTHHATARGPAALGKAAKNFHSLRVRRRSNTGPSFDMKIAVGVPRLFLSSVRVRAQVGAASQPFWRARDDNPASKLLHLPEKPGEVDPLLIPSRPHVQFGTNAVDFAVANL